jgi:hypothetical protein
MFSHALQWTQIGWSDATTGPLLLRIQSHYSVSYPIVSLLFICAFVGFFTAAVVNIWLTDKIGYGKALVLASSCQVSFEGSKFRAFEVSRLRSRCDLSSDVTYLSFHLDFRILGSRIRHPSLQAPLPPLLDILHPQRDRYGPPRCPR